MLDFKSRDAIALEPSSGGAAPPRPAKAGPSRWQRFAALTSPGLFSGVTLGTWLRVLRDNRFDIDHPYWVRAAAVTFGAVPNSILGCAERLLFGRAVRRTVAQPPLFVLGLPRSGTTHLHNLLARDRRFAFPNSYQVLYPHTFLLTERWHAPLIDSVMDRKRPMDNVRFGVAEPQEDEWALAAMTGRSCLLTGAFPRRAAQQRRYLTLRDLNAAERAEWKAALRRLVQKLSYKYGRPLVLKSPGHTGRVRTLLELFPDARFVHIRRDPYAVFQSALHTQRVAGGGDAYQHGDDTDAATDLLRAFRELTDAFFDDRALIPPGRLHELHFEELEDDPVTQLRQVYQALGLPDFATFEPALRAYLRSLAGYEKNCHGELSPGLKSRVAAEWGRLFDEWGYPR